MESKGIKSTGIVRKVDGLGRIVLPKEIRDHFGFETGVPLEFLISEGYIVLRHYRPGCFVCGEIQDIVKSGGVVLCPKCLKEMYKKL